MKIGVVFPQTEIGDDPEVVSLYATTAERLGFSHLLAYDHVLGANTASRPDWVGPYTMDSIFHEPLVLFGFLAGQTQRLEFASAILILPQRQAALVAKQAAAVDVLSGGRLRLGVGAGWNPVEFMALGENFRNRGVRGEEQIEVMRRLWAEPTIEYEGKWHTIPDAGIKPLPPQRKIPVWIGGGAPAVLDRVGRIADGWFPFDQSNLSDDLARIREVARQHGRDPDEIGVECIVAPDATPEAARDRFKSLEDLGVSHISVSMMNLGITDPQAHVDALSGYWDAVGPLCG
ncbi:MAG: LLM class F420-dependent oxidoreductase [bacterium]|nr:LLM class F420-dependent oxidoreductase [Deltaproteobacteria bacterium]MCP4904022.1 LLM class F420-dependent oxidoreductase [bacterium]